MKLLGISAYYHDSAIAFVDNESVLFAAQEERYSRNKNDASFPIYALKQLMKEQKVELQDFDAIVFYDKPFLKLERIVETYLYHSPFGFASFKYSMPRWIRQQLFFKRTLKENLLQAFNSKYKKYKLLFCDHHLSHAAQAFFTSSFEDAAIISIDGVGEWATTTVKYGNRNNITSLYEQSFPNSAGLLFSSFTHFLGFKVNSGEYKVMGLAPYGNKSSEAFNRCIRHIKEDLVKIFDDGSVYLNPQYFTYASSLRMIHTSKWEKLFRIAARQPDSTITQEHCDLALAAQTVIEEIVLKLAMFARKLTKADSLCISGGVGLNCVANGKLQEHGVFTNIHIPFSPGDSGSAIGAALAASHIYYKIPRNLDKEKKSSPYNGERFDDLQILYSLNEAGLRFIQPPDSELFEFIASEISKGKIIGWFQGKAEFGPRALGNRSIIADPRAQDMQSKINSKIKGRESFRPFAPSVLENFVSELYYKSTNSSHMQFVFAFREEHRYPAPNSDEDETIESKLRTVRSKFPAITHVDFTSRVQSVSQESNTRFWNLIQAYYKITGCPMLLNTSFNRNEEPIVNSPREAIDCFLSTDLDILVLNNYIVVKSS